MECLKFLMFGFNVVFWLIGATMLGVGIWLVVDPAAFSAIGVVESAGMDNETWEIAVYTFLGIGALVFIVGFLGCWGACISDSSSIPLWIYSILVGVILAGEIAVVILTCLAWGTVADTEVVRAMYYDVRTKYDDDDPNDALYTSWNTMQKEWQCCGAYNHTDYKNSLYDNTSIPEEYWVPVSCCNDSTKVIECQSGDSLYIYSQGCYDALKEFLDQNAPIIIGVTCGFAALQIIGLIFACCLICKKSDKGKYV